MYFYPMVEGKIEEEKVHKIFELKNENLEKYNSGILSYKDKNGNTLYSHANIITLQTLIEDLEYTYLYPLNMEKIVNQSKENLKFFDTEKHIYEINKNKKIIKDYSNRYIPKFGLTRGYELLFNYKISSLVLLFILILPLSSLFAEEKENKYYQIFIGEKVKKRCIKFKIISSYIFIFVLSLIFYIMDIFCFNRIWPMNEIFNPIYSLKLYKNTFLNTSIFSFLIINFLFMLIAYIFFGTLFMIVSLNSKKVFVSLVINYIILISVIILSDFINIPFNPFNLLNNKDMFKGFYVKRILSYHIYEPWYYLIFSLIFIFLLMCVLKRSVKKW
ncbi:hypothetical protein [Defluviitalea phaphyphila]|uniref:hypothetical protein n=1 Tax=Defluviitalea phaphyphila TaxID=1473580 RepID=UPI001A9A49EB|nr:hypothetical protein [Defluviitalea phaphyphila]